MQSIERELLISACRLGSRLRLGEPLGKAPDEVGRALEGCRAIWADSDDVDRSLANMLLELVPALRSTLHSPFQDKRRDERRRAVQRVEDAVRRSLSTPDEQAALRIRARTSLDDARVMDASLADEDRVPRELVALLFEALAWRDTQVDQKAFDSLMERALDLFPLSDEAEAAIAKALAAEP